MRVPITLLALVWFSIHGPSAEVNAPQRAAQIQHLIDDADALAGVPFPELIHAVSGRHVIPLIASNAADGALLDRISAVLDEVVRRMNAPDSLAHGEARINEVSAHFEKELRERFANAPGFACDWPRTAAGATQRSGYPDLRLVDQKSGRVIYLDPKLFEVRNRSSSLRTFYFTPKRETNKVTDDAHHILIGFAHAGRTEGRWQFTGWEMVDLARFRVRLKAEFQAANRDLYRDETVVRRSQPAGAGKPSHLGN